jgi:hypothetical protein
VAHQISDDASHQEHEDQKDSLAATAAATATVGATGPFVLATPLFLLFFWHINLHQSIISIKPDVGYILSITRTGKKSSLLAGGRDRRGDSYSIVDGLWRGISRLWTTPSFLKLVKFVNVN